MRDSNPEYDRLLAAINLLPRGRQRVEVYQKCVDLADKNKDKERQIRYRLILMDESCLHDDGLKGYIVFPVVLKISDELFKETGTRPHIDDILWQYKWLIEDARYFYQVKQDQFEKLVNDAVVRFRNEGYGSRSIYLQAARFYVYSDPAKADEYFNLFLSTPRDGNSDCMACERNAEYDYLLSKGRYLIAMHKAQPLFEGRLRCSDVPHMTFLSYMLYYSEKKLKGETIPEEVLALMTDYAARCRKGFIEKHLVIESLGILLAYYVLFEPGKVLRFLKIFADYTEKYQYNSYGIFYFSIGMMLFIKSLGDKKTYKMKMEPGFRFYNPDNTYDLAEMYEYYRAQAAKIADGYIEAQKNDSFRKYYELVTGFEF